MTNTKLRKILFISHDATMTGAPILLLRLADELVKTGRFQISFLIGNDGPLREKFEKIGSTYLWNNDSRRSLLQRGFDKVFTKVGFPAYTSRNRLKAKILMLSRAMDFIVANTVISADIVMEFPKAFKNIIFYIHELHVIVEEYSSAKSMEFINKVASRVLVPSLYVKNFLVKHFHFEDEKIEILQYIIPEDVKSVNRSEAILSSNTNYLAGACGTLHWRKGHDIFVSIVRTLVKDRKCSDIHFLWLGAELNSLEYKVFKNDLIKCNIEENVTVIPHTDDIREYIKQLDVFLLTSREDAYPLVVLEAASYDIPSICFNSSGGIPEFAGSDAGIVVDYLDINAYCDAIIALKNQPEYRAILGEKARKKMEFCSNPGNIVKKFESCLQLK